MASMAFHFGTLSVSEPKVSEAWIRLVRTSRHTAISMVALISVGPAGSALVGAFSGEMEGTNM